MTMHVTRAREVHDEEHLVTDKLSVGSVRDGCVLVLRSLLLRPKISIHKTKVFCTDLI